MNTAAIYRVGTLKYTQAGLVTLFVWLLWGDFCYNLMLQIMPQLMPLFLNRYGASPELISILMIMFPEAVNLLLNPIISTASDRTRTRWGRRRPYLLFTAPFLGLFLLLLGWSAEIGQWLASLLGSGSEAEAAAVIVAVASVLLVSFKIFETFCTSVIYYIFNDVVPHQFIGSFTALFRIVGFGAVFVFQRYFMQFADEHMQWVFTGGAVLYVVGMTVMCLMVKEGEYPPVAENEKKASMLGKLKLYWEECFSMAIYNWFFFGVAINTVSTACRTTYNVLFATEELGLSTGEFGVTMSYYPLVIIALTYPVGWLADRIPPILLYIGGGVLITLVNIFGFYLVNDGTSFLVLTILLAVVYVLQTASYLPMHMKMLPQEKYGQFCSAGVIVRGILMIGISGLSGYFIKFMGLYRYLFIWDFFFTIAGTFCLFMAYMYWRRLGGATGNYVAPIPGNRN